MDSRSYMYRRNRQTKEASGFEHDGIKNRFLREKLSSSNLRLIIHSLSTRGVFTFAGRVEELLHKAYAISSEFEKIKRSYETSSSKYFRAGSDDSGYWVLRQGDYKSSASLSDFPAYSGTRYAGYHGQNSSPVPEDDSYFKLPSMPSLGDVLEAGSDLIDSGSYALGKASQKVSEGVSNASDSFTRNRIGNLYAEKSLNTELREIAKVGHASVERKLEQTNEFLESFLKKHLHNRSFVSEQQSANLVSYDALFLASLVASHNCMRVQHKIVVDTIGELNNAIDKFNSKQLAGRGKNSDELVDNLVEFANTLELQISDMEGTLLDVAPAVAANLENYSDKVLSIDQRPIFGDDFSKCPEPFLKTELEYREHLDTLVSSLKDEVGEIRESSFSKTIFGGIESGFDSLRSSLTDGEAEITATQIYNSEHTDEDFRQHGERPNFTSTQGEFVVAASHMEGEKEKSQLERLQDSIVGLPASAKEWNDERIEENDHAIQSLKLAEQLQAIFKVQQLLLRHAEGMDISYETPALLFALNPAAEISYGQLFFNQHVSDTISGKRSHGRLVDGGVAAGGAAVVAAGGGLIVSGFLSGGMIPLGVGAVAGITSLAALAKAALTHNQVSLEEFLQASSTGLVEISREELNLEHLLTFTHQNFYKDPNFHMSMGNILRGCGKDSGTLLKKIEAELLLDFNLSYASNNKTYFLLDPKLEDRRQELIKQRSEELAEYYDFANEFEQLDQVNRDEEEHPAKKAFATGLLSTVAGVHGIYKSVSEGIDSLKDSVRVVVNGETLTTNELYQVQLNALENIPLIIKKYGVTQLPNILAGLSDADDIQVDFSAAFYNVDKVVGQSDVQTFVDEVLEHYKSNIAGPAEVLAAHAFAAYRPDEQFQRPQRQDAVGTEDNRGGAPQPSSYQGGYGNT